MNAKNLIREEQIASIENSIREAETKTGAEIVCAVATESGRYDRAESIFGLIGALLALAGGHLVAQTIDNEGLWSAPADLSLLVQTGLLTGGFLTGTILASLSKSLRTFAVSQKEIDEEIQRSAQIVLSNAILASPRSAGAVLLYISVAERRASIVCDQLAMTALEQETLNVICTAMITQIKKKNITESLLTGVSQLTEHLSEKIPATENNPDELENHILLIHPRP